MMRIPTISDLYLRIGKWNIRKKDTCQTKDVHILLIWVNLVITWIIEIIELTGSILTKQKIFRLGGGRYSTTNEEESIITSILGVHSPKYKRLLRFSTMTNANTFQNPTVAVTRTESMLVSSRCPDDKVDNLNIIQNDEVPEWLLLYSKADDSLDHLLRV